MSAVVALRTSGEGTETFLNYMVARGIGTRHTDDLASRIVTALAPDSTKDVAGLLAATGTPPLSELLEAVDRLR